MEFPLRFQSYFIATPIATFGKLKSEIHGHHICLLVSVTYPCMLRRLNGKEWRPLYYPLMYLQNRRVKWFLVVVLDNRQFASALEEDESNINLSAYLWRGDSRPSTEKEKNKITISKRKHARLSSPKWPWSESKSLCHIVDMFYGLTIHANTRFRKLHRLTWLTVIHVIAACWWTRSAVSHFRVI